MAPRAATSKLSQLVDSASEDEFQRSDHDTLLTPDSALENAAPARRGPGGARAKTTTGVARVTKAKGAAATAVNARKGTAAAIAKKGKVAPASRPALAERPNPSDTEEVDDLDGEVAFVPAQEARAATKPRKAATSKTSAQLSSKERVNMDEGQEENQPRSMNASTKAVRPVKTTKPRKKAQQETPETQPEPMEVEPSVFVDEEPEPDHTIAEPAPRPASQQTGRARSVPKQQPRPGYRRAGSASDTERVGGGGSDPALRRKLGEMTRKFENLDLKYRNLREIGMRDAESNFEKLRKSTDERAKAQDELIASLKRELATQRSLAADSKSLRGELTAARNETSQMSSENSRLVSDHKALSASLQTAQNENKALATKLAAARNTVKPTPPVDSSNGTKPGASTAKSLTQRPMLVGSAEVVKEAQVRQLKEDMYSDLTGLIIRGVKKSDGEDIYDCIQTGRNGTLHFHLSISSEEQTGKPSSTSYEDAEFAYTPLLDESRDRDLLDILPDYLTEEICFPRSSAAKFYAKVMDCMTKKIVLEE